MRGAIVVGVLCLAGLAALNVVSAGNSTPVVEEGFVSLFDGKSLAGWVGGLSGYGVEDGVLISLPGAKGNLLTEKEYSDFVFKFEFKLTPGANNGVGIRCPLEPEASLHLEGTELQILDDSSEKYTTLKPYQYHGSVYGVVPAERGSLKPVGEWNEQEVKVKGRHVKVVVNGKTIVNADLDAATKNGTLDATPHPGLSRAKGHVGFLGHRDRVDFRNIRIKDLSQAQ